jgi:putative endonuclease
MEAWVYILRCADGTLYTGWTFDPESRTTAHNSGKGARYTASRLPVEIVYKERLSSKEEALRREISIKKMRRIEKERLVKGPTDDRSTSSAGNSGKKPR